MNEMISQALLGHCVGHVRFDLPYLPIPNSVETILSPLLAPPDLTRTAFCVPFLEDGSLVLAHNRRRGLEFPGGHRDPGEEASAAARRELFEETGYLAEVLIPLGFLRMISEGEPPTGWSYPHPVGFQQFFAARVTRSSEYVENDECLAPRVIPGAQIGVGEPVLSSGQMAFVQEARQLLRLL